MCFNKQKRYGKVGLQPYCKKCSSEVRIEYYKNNREKENQYDKNKRQQAQNKIWEFKKTPCADCNQSFHPVCMDFDHISDKKFSIAEGINIHKYPMNKLLKEIEKCEVVCANCHRKRTWERKHGPIV